MSKRWGEPTWYFFHTFIEKITPFRYSSIHVEIINIYETICKNLPCPLCRDHAMKYLKGNNIKGMVTRDKMKMFLFNFHNDVNVRLNKSKQPIQMLEQYKRINIIRAHQYFEQEFYKQDYISKHFSGWIKNQLKYRLNAFFRENICHFKA